jgi:hypothetical protein
VTGLWHKMRHGLLCDLFANLFLFYMPIAF